MGLTATPSGAAAQTLASPTSRQGLDREVRAALLRVRTRPKCPEGNLRGLTRESNPNRGTAREKKKKKEERERDRTFPFPFSLLTGSKLHNKEEPQTSSIQKGHPKYSNLNKMKKQRNIQQVKEHDKCPPNQRGGDREST